MLTDPHHLLIDTLDRLEGCLRARDLDGAVACFVPDGAIFGEELLEQAHGTTELTLLLAEVLEHSFAVGWDVHETWVRIVGQTAWFVASASLVLHDGEQEVGREPFAMSGVLRGGGVLPLRALQRHAAVAATRPAAGRRRRGWLNG